MNNIKYRWTVLFAILVIAGIAFVLIMPSYSGYLEYEHPEGYVQSIDPASYKEHEIEIPSTITKYELITINANEFKQNADTGNLDLSLVGEKFILDMEPGIWVNEGLNESLDDENGITIKREMEPIYQYSGKVEDQPRSEASFTLDKQTVLGWIVIQNERYIIEQVGWVMDNETKKTVYVAYKESDVESINWYDINAEEHEQLYFTMKNEDVYPHEVVVKIFDSSGILIFTNNYALDPDQFIKSPSVIDEIDDGNIYMYKATLENNITSIYNFTVNSNAAASIHIYNDSENAEAYIDFGYTIE